MTARALGIGAVGWPLAIGAGLAASQRLLRIEMGRRGAAPIPAASAVPFLLWSALVLLLAVGVAKRRALRGDGRPFAVLFRQTLHRIAFLLVVPLALVVREPLELPRGWSLLASAALAGTLTAFSAYHWSTDAERVERRWARPVATTLLTVLALAYAFVVIRIAFINHISFNTGRSDLGYYLSVFRKSSQGVPLGCSLCGGGTHTTGHFDPILVPLSAFFLLYPFAETLLVIQAVWLAAGAIPVYLLGRVHVGHRGAALALAASYLAYPALHGVNFFDFHSIALSITPFLWFLYFIEQRRPRAALGTLAVLLLVREDVSIAATLVGLSAVFSGDRVRVRIGWTTVVLSVAYFLVAKIVFMGHADPLNMPAGGKGGYALFYEEMIPSGRSTRALVETLIGDPLYSLGHVLAEARVDYLALLFVPLLGLPLLARGRIQLAYGFAVTLLATARLYSVHAQYSSTLVPVMFGLALSALGRIRSAPELPLGVSGPRAARALSFGVLVSSLLVSWKFGGLIENETFIAGFRPLVRQGSPWPMGNDAWLRSFALSLPRGASVAANSRLVPHLGPVSNLYMIDDRDKADYVIANMQNREIATLILADVAKGYLVPYIAKEPLRIYKARYPKAPRATGVPGGDPEPGGS